MIPPLVTVSAAHRSTSTRSKRGRNFLNAFPACGSNCTLKQENHYNKTTIKKCLKKIPTHNDFSFERDEYYKTTYLTAANQYHLWLHQKLLKAQADAGQSWQLSRRKMYSSRGTNHPRMEHPPLSGEASRLSHQTLSCYRLVGIIIDYINYISSVYNQI